MNLDMSDILQATRRLLDQREHDQTAFQAEFATVLEDSELALDRFDSLVAELKDTLAQA
jgi:hypothetical protein